MLPLTPLGAAPNASNSASPLTPAAPTSLMPPHLDMSAISLQDQVNFVNYRDLEGAKETYELLVKYIVLSLKPPYTSSTIVKLLSVGVKYMQEFKNLSGIEKKDMVLHAIRDAIQNEVPPSSQDLLLSTIDLIGSDMIDQIVAFGKDMVTFSMKTCFPCCKK